MYFSLISCFFGVLVFSGDSFSLLANMRESSRSNIPEETTSHFLTDVTPINTEQSDVRKTDEKNEIISESALIQTLFKYYDKRSRPVRSIDTPVVITVDLYPIITEQLNEREQKLVSHVWLFLEWKDEFLQWNASEWSGTKYITVQAKDIWRPELVIQNSAGSVHGEVVNSNAQFRVIVSADGDMSMMTAGESQTSCLVDITYFPFDDQACYVEIVSWTDGNSRVKLINKNQSLDLTGYRTGGQWYVIGTEVKQQTQYETVDEYTSLVFIMYLRRKPLYYVFNLVLPSVILAMLALLVFILPPEAGEKMSLGITVLLSFTVFQLLVADSMPKTSEYIPVIAIYITSTMVMTAFSLLLSVGILSIHYHWPDEPVSERCKRMADVFAKGLWMKTYWSSTPMGQVRLDVNDIHAFRSMTWNYRTNSETLKHYLLLASIVDDLKYLRNNHEQDNLSRARRYDWVQVARVFDRFLLAVFLLFNIVMVIGLFVIFPSSKGDRPYLNVQATPKLHT